MTKRVFIDFIFVILFSLKGTFFGELSIFFFPVFLNQQFIIMNEKSIKLMLNLEKVPVHYLVRPVIVNIQSAGTTQSKRQSNSIP
jgi:hypothetical protein